MAIQCPKPKRKRDATWFRDKVLLVKAQGSGKMILDAYDSDCDDFSTAKAVLMANLSSYGSDVLSEVNKDNLIANESLSTKLERYKERVKLLEEKQNADLETLMFEDESQSKMLLKQSDPIVLENKVNIKPVNYAVLNQLSEDFGKSFVLQQELFAEQAFRFQMSNPSTDSSDASPVKVPGELLKVSLVNASLKKIKFHLAQLDSVVEKRITPDALTEANINDSVNVNENVNSMEMCNKCLELEAELFKQHNIVEKDEYDKLSKKYSKLEQHLNNLKAHLQAKDTMIKKLKAQIKCVSETSTSESVKKYIDEIETINIKLEHRVAKLIAKNEHLK
ncbi:hypothetical protein Tco_0026669 [Tanacetum coccineum]